MKNNKPVISVVIPTYNTGKYIEQTLNSVLNQSFQNIEILVIDDGSTDNTLEILENYKNRIKIFTKSNGGPASARNVGVKNSKGSYIALIDADDLWASNKLKVQYQFMKNNPDIGLTYTDVICFEVNNGVKKYLNKYICRIEGRAYKEEFWSNFITNSSVMIKKECFDKVGIFDESKNIIGSEDYDMWLRILKEYCLGVIPDVLTEYRIHPRNLIGTSYKKALPLHKCIYEKHFNLYTDLNSIIGLNMSQAIGDLYLRYSYREKSKRNIRGAILLAISAFKYAPFKSTICVIFLILKRDNWSNLITNYLLWKKIVS